jgi:hypothetical protein
VGRPRLRLVRVGDARTLQPVPPLAVRPRAITPARWRADFPPCYELSKSFVSSVPCDRFNTVDASPGRISTPPTSEAIRPGGVAQQRPERDPEVG